MNYIAYILWTKPTAKPLHRMAENLVFLLESWIYRTTDIYSGLRSLYRVGDTHPGRSLQQSTKLLTVSTSYEHFCTESLHVSHT